MVLAAIATLMHTVATVIAAWRLGPWTGLALGDSPLALRDIGTEEIYALDWEAP